MDLLYPLSAFYREAGLAVPAAFPVEPHEVPEPERSLLVHNCDMTPTIEAAFGQRLHLRLLNRRLKHDSLSRQVLLVLDDGRVVCMGAIRIYLDRFSDEAKRLILEGRVPLGTILAVQRIPHSSSPLGYFRVAPDAGITGALQLNGAQPLLYGRQNVLSDLTGEVLAKVVEILPPSDDELSGEKT